VSPVLGSYVFFAFDDARALQNVQWVYLAISIFVFLLAVVFYFSDIPEITEFVDFSFHFSSVFKSQSSVTIN
jgi:FHS family L-fucose permease-like MFS transporter